MPKAWWQPCCWTMAWCSHSPFKLSTSHPRPSLWHLEAIQPVHSWAGTCVQHAAHQSLKDAMTHWSLRLLYKLEVVYMKSDWYASQACTRYTIAHVNREWCFIKKFTGSQLHYIVQNQIIWVLRCIRNCHTLGELISFPCLRWRWLRLYPCISSLLFSHSPIYLSYFGHEVQTLQTPFIATQLPTSLSSRCNKLPPFSGFYIYLAFPVQLTSPKTPIPAVARPPHHLQDYILY